MHNLCGVFVLAIISGFMICIIHDMYLTFHMLCIIKAKLRTKIAAAIRS